MLDPEYISLITSAALAEDIGKGDITAELIPPDSESGAEIKLKEDAIICGTAFATQAFKLVDTNVHVNWLVHDGDAVEANTVVCRMHGPSRSLLTSERTALNFLQTLSGTATTTHCLVEMIKHTKCKLADTRKTIPGLRTAQKYAVMIGGGTNHRKGLFDAYLIKENHILACGSISRAVATAQQQNPKKFLEVEVENIEEFEEALATNVRRIMLDGFDIATIKKALKMPHDGVAIEVSGIDVEDLVKIAELGVDYISLGLLTKNVESIDFSLRIVQ
jgi:nicotinate-nucleotide pyrophosphorylase (carboxylating)